MYCYIELLMLDTNTITFDTYSYSLLSMLHVSASFTPSSGISTPRFNYLLHLLTARSRVLLEKLAGLQLVKKFPTRYGTRRFITAFTTAGHLSLS